jgi:hypothetical protein
MVSNSGERYDLAGRYNVWLYIIKGWLMFSNSGERYDLAGQYMFGCISKRDG